MSEPQPASTGVLSAAAPTDRRPRVLVIVDRAAGTDTPVPTADALSADGFRLEPARGLPDGLTVLAQEQVDCVLLDLPGVDAQGYEALARLRTQRPDVPVVVRTPDSGEDLGPALIAAGAEDAVCRGDGQALARALRHAIARQRARQRTAAAELEVQGARERRDVGRLLDPNRHPGEAARIYGAATLRETDPDLFDEIVGDYVELIKHTAEGQVYRTEPATVRSARPLAEHLGFLGAGPRDTIEIHTEALIRLDRELSTANQRQIALEGRIVVLELMGYLVSYYRRYYLNSMPRAHDLGGAVERQPD
ncbi:MAG: response regulator [Lamprocystis purpurea]|jgi:CheY-like chemotaxis protein|uniref:response regulator n=1 Tax=Lamprocystis purpurea TaxID=61598 RepID=UPI000368F33D|nr:response regulator [Lamprocystis purpurea]MBV5274915.1 response regulator [Lamprocystis purpurea]